VKTTLPRLLISIILAGLILGAVPGDSLALGRPSDAGALERLPRAVRSISRQAYQDWPVIASIEKVGNNAQETVEFTLDACTAMRLYAMGEGNEYGMKDFGSIEDAATGQIVWQMYYFETEYGGGSRKRLVDRPLSLPAGSYRLHYQTNASYSYEDSPALQSEDDFWGIALYEDISGESRATCWERARPEELGWSSGGLEHITPELERMNCAALMIVTDGRVVFEWGNTANNFLAHSVRKSLLSGLYGIYVAEGKIDLSKTLAELGIDDKVPLSEEEKQATVNDLLKARSGVYIPAAGEAASMKENRPERHSHAPGTFWYYNNWDFNALGTIFDQETGEENIYVAFQRRIADPIGMQDFRIDNLGYTYESYSAHPYYGMRISARDLARFGQLFLQKGVWQGLQVVPADWVEESTYPYSLTGAAGIYSGYGYMWWIAARDQWGIKEGSYAASGYGGHTLEVLPDINTVIVFRINTDDPSVALTSGAAVDQLILRILQASDRADTPYKRVRYPMLAWAVLAAGSLLLFLLDLLRVRGPWAMSLAWALVIALFGPLGLLAYGLSYRRARPSSEWRPLPWRRALGASLYSGAGYAIGWILTTLCFFYLWPSRHPLVTLAVSYAVPLTIGLLLFRAPLLAATLGVRYGRALRRSVLAEVISLNLALAGMLPLGVLGLDHWMPRPLDVASLLFWAVLVLTVTAGAFLIYPYNLWLARRGLAGWWPAEEGEDDVAVPSWRNAWGAFLLSLAALIVSVVLTALLLA